MVCENFIRSTNMNLKNFPKRLNSKTSCLRITVPDNLDLALEGLIRKVLKEQPKTDDIYTFAANYFETLLKIRDKVGTKYMADQICPFHNDEDAHEMVKLANNFPKPPVETLNSSRKSTAKKKKDSENRPPSEIKKSAGKKLTEEKRKAAKPTKIVEPVRPSKTNQKSKILKPSDLSQNILPVAEALLTEPKPKKLSPVIIPETETSEVPLRLSVEENPREDEIEFLKSDPIKELVEKELMSESGSRKIRQTDQTEETKTDELEKETQGSDILEVQANGEELCTVVDSLVTAQQGKDSEKPKNEELHSEEKETAEAVVNEKETPIEETDKAKEPETTLHLTETESEKVEDFPLKTEESEEKSVASVTTTKEEDAVTTAKEEDMVTTATEDTVTTAKEEDTVTIEAAIPEESKDVHETAEPSQVVEEQDSKEENLDKENSGPVTLTEPEKIPLNEVLDKETIPSEPNETETSLEEKDIESESREKTEEQKPEELISSNDKPEDKEDKPDKELNNLSEVEKNEKELKEEDSTVDAENQKPEETTTVSETETKEEKELSVDDNKAAEEVLVQNDAQSEKEPMVEEEISQTKVYKVGAKDDKQEDSELKTEEVKTVEEITPSAQISQEETNKAEASETVATTELNSEVKAEDTEVVEETPTNEKQISVDSAVEQENKKAEPGSDVKPEDTKSETTAITDEVPSKDKTSEEASKAEEPSIVEETENNSGDLKPVEDEPVGEVQEEKAQPSEETEVKEAPPSEEVKVAEPQIEVEDASSVNQIPVATQDNKAEDAIEIKQTEVTQSTPEEVETEEAKTSAEKEKVETAPEEIPNEKDNEPETDTNVSETTVNVEDDLPDTEEASESKVEDELIPLKDVEIDSQIKPEEGQEIKPEEEQEIKPEEGQEIKPESEAKPVEEKDQQETEAVAVEATPDVSKETEQPIAKTGDTDISEEQPTENEKLGEIKLPDGIAVMDVTTTIEETKVESIPEPSVEAVEFVEEGILVANIETKIEEEIVVQNAKVDTGNEDEKNHEVVLSNEEKTEEKPAESGEDKPNEQEIENVEAKLEKTKSESDLKSEEITEDQNVPEEELCSVVDKLQIKVEEADQPQEERQIKTITTHLYDFLQVPQTVTKEYKVHHTKDPALLASTLPLTRSYLPLQESEGRKDPEPDIGTTDVETDTVEVVAEQPETDLPPSDGDDLTDLMTPTSGYSLNLSELSWITVSEMFLESERQYSSREIKYVTPKTETPDTYARTEVEEIVHKTVLPGGVRAVPDKPREDYEIEAENVEIVESKKDENPPEQSSSDDSNEPTIETSGSKNGKSIDSDTPIISVEVKTVIETQVLDEEDETEAKDEAETLTEDVPDVEVEIEATVEVSEEMESNSARNLTEAAAVIQEEFKKYETRKSSEKKDESESQQSSLDFQSTGVEHTLLTSEESTVQSVQSMGREGSSLESDSTVSSAVTEIKRSDSAKRNFTRGSTQNLLTTQSLDSNKRNPLLKTRSLSSFRQGVTDFEVWNKIERELEKAATTIQSKYRGYTTRKRLRRENAVQITTEESSSSTTPVEPEPKDQSQQSTGEFHDSIVLSVHPR